MPRPIVLAEYGSAASQAAKRRLERSQQRSQRVQPSTSAGTRASWHWLLQCTRKLIDGLILRATTQPACKQPVRTHAERVVGSQRGIGLATLETMLEIFTREMMLSVPTSEASRGEHRITACNMTLHTGLSVAESLLLIAEETGVSCDGIVGTANAYMCYSWDSTNLGDLLKSAISVLRAQEQQHGGARYLFLDLFAASQNLISGRYGRLGGERDQATSEDYDLTFEQAFMKMDTVAVLLTPLFGEPWLAPLDTQRVVHGYLDEALAQPTERFECHGPMALTRAWCIKEIAQGIVNGCNLQIEFDAQGRRDVQHAVAVGECDPLRDLITSFDFTTVQCRRAKDRARIMDVVKAAGGFTAIRQQLLLALDEQLVSMRHRQV